MLCYAMAMLCYAIMLCYGYAMLCYRAMLWQAPLLELLAQRKHAVAVTPGGPRESVQRHLADHCLDAYHELRACNTKGAQHMMTGANEAMPGYSMPCYAMRMPGAYGPPSNPSAPSHVLRACSVAA